ncbi:MAG: DegT/DnrJ/EryC1/StrS family aminotransferase [Lachnospiraceae bacterium]|nr:DegT/DnrJ/EryC1/StrS family aminotransferase [Lachnospiraceae bacterium]
MEYIDLKAQYQYLKKEIDNNIAEVINSTSFILGDYVEKFEKELAAYIGVKHAISCSDGTAALQLIYMANHIGHGDAVFCPDMTFIASIEPACLLGATPVFCEIDNKTYNIDPDSLERQIVRVLEEGMLNPKAVVAVDFLGNPAQFKKIREIADKYGLLVIEDAAQGMGAVYGDQKCGSLGDIAATSFFPSKPLGCYGDGGAVFTNDDEMDKLLRSLRVHGKGKTKYDNEHIGINSRLDNLQAAILLPKLHVLEEEITIRQEVADYYKQKLQDYVGVPYVSSDCVSAYAQFVIWAESETERETLQQRLGDEQIPTIRYYPTPMHRLPVFEGINTYGENFDITDQYAACTLGIPFSPYIEKGDMDRVIHTIINVLKEYR